MTTYTYDLSAVTVNSGTYSGGEIHPPLGGYATFIDPTYTLYPPGAPYLVEFDLRVLSGGPGYEAWVIGSSSSSGWESSAITLVHEENTTQAAGSTVTVSLTMGPGIEDWTGDLSHIYLDLEVFNADVLAVRIGEAPPPADPPVFELDFEDFTASDPVVGSEWRAGFGSSTPDTVLQTVSVVDSGGSRRMRITLPADAIFDGGYDTGLAVNISKTPNARVGFFQDFRWPIGVPFGKGGKLLGVGGATTGHSPPTGGTGRVTYGWSLRWMWRTSGRLIGYAYHVNQTGTYGDDLYTDFYLTPGEWVRLGIEVDTTTGEVVYSANGTPVYSTTLDLLGIPFSHFIADVFRGGGDSTWTVSADTPLDFDNLLLTTGGDAPEDDGSYTGDEDYLDDVFGIEFDCSGYGVLVGVLDPDVPAAVPSRLVVPATADAVLVDGRLV